MKYILTGHRALAEKINGKPFLRKLRGVSSSFCVDAYVVSLGGLKAFEG